jgi:FlaA1/EpsC-like NDP-sugar epimerase
MARDIISLSGFKPEEEIEIKYTGLRPGEKLYEELITEGEDIEKTAHEEIMVLNGENGMSVNEMDLHIENLVKLVKAGNAMGIKKALKRMVPEYVPWEEEKPRRTLPPL